MIYIGVDLGTTSICCVAVDSEIWQIKEIKTALNTTTVKTDNAWDKKQDADKIYHIAKNLIDSMINSYSNVGGIAFSTQMHGILYVNKKGNAVSPLYTWQNHCSNLISKKTNMPYYKELESQLGRNVPTGYGLSTHYTLQKLNKIPNTACKFCSIGDYVAMKLIQRVEPVSDITLAESYGAVFLGEKNYNYTNLKKSLINTSFLPEIIASDTVIGTYKNIPIITAIGDNQASFLGSITNLYTDAVISLGTSGQITCFSKDLLTVQGVETRPFLKNGFILSGASLCGGHAYTLLKNFFTETLNWFGNNELTVNNSIFKKLDTISPLDFNSLPIITTTFYGTRTNPHAYAQIQGLNENNFSPQHITAGVVLGIITELKDFFELFPPKIKNHIIQIFGSGSFFNKHPFVQQCCEKLFNLPVYKTPYNEEGAFGAIINIGIALNRFSSYNEAVSQIKAFNNDRKQTISKN